jgi:hypothetical protein
MISGISASVSTPLVSALDPVELGHFNDSILAIETHFVDWSWSVQPKSESVTHFQCIVMRSVPAI